MKDLIRKIRIIGWLIPRFNKGLSNPKNYMPIIASRKPRLHK